MEFPGVSDVEFRSSALDSGFGRLRIPGFVLEFRVWGLSGSGFRPGIPGLGVFGFRVSSWNSKFGGFRIPGFVAGFRVWVQSEFRVSLPDSGFRLGIPGFVGRRVPGFALLDSGFRRDSRVEFSTT